MTSNLILITRPRSALVRATAGPQPQRSCVAADLIRAGQPDLMYQAAKGIGDGLIPVPGRMLADQRGPFLNRTPWSGGFGSLVAGLDPGSESGFVGGGKGAAGGPSHSTDDFWPHLAQAQSAWNPVLVRTDSITPRRSSARP